MTTGLRGGVNAAYSSVSMDGLMKIAASLLSEHGERPEHDQAIAQLVKECFMLLNDIPDLVQRLRTMRST